MQDSSTDRCRVLLVEDDRTHREFVSAILRNFHCEVIYAVDGQEALNLAREQNFDLVLMDLEMPRMDGLTAARELREMRRHNEIDSIPIIAITSDPDEKVKDECRAAGMVEFIPKSIWRPQWEPNIRAKLMPWIEMRMNNPARVRSA